MAAKLNIKVGDTVKVIAGADKNKKENTGKEEEKYDSASNSFEGGR